MKRIGGGAGQWISADAASAPVARSPGQTRSAIAQHFVLAVKYSLRRLPDRAVREQQLLRDVHFVRDALFRAASELDQLVNQITSGEQAMRSSDGAQAIASVGASEQSALWKYRRTLDAVMEILQETRAEQRSDSENAGKPEINDTRSALDRPNQRDQRTTTLQAIQDELRQNLESLKSANDVICSANQMIEMLTQTLVTRIAQRPIGDGSSSQEEPAVRSDLGGAADCG